MEYALRFNGKDIVVCDVLFNLELHCDMVIIELVNTPIAIEIGLKQIRVLRGYHMPTIFDVERNGSFAVKLMTGSRDIPEIHLVMDANEIRFYHPEVIDESE